MQNTTIVRKRLNDLKILSQNLKQSTEYTNEPDPNLIRAILNITKSSIKEDMQRYNSQSSINFKRQQSQSQSLYSIPLKIKKTNSITQSILSKHLSKTQLINSNNNNGILRINQQQDQPLFPQQNQDGSKPLTNSRLIRSNSPPHLHNSNEHQQQIVHLRQQNIELQIQLKEAKQKLKKFKQKQQKKNRIYINSDEEQQIQNNNEPYFKLNETMSLFFTRITVSQQDYKKVQYTNKNLKLTLDKLVIQKASSSYLGKSLNLQSSKVTNSNIELTLSNLLQIQYLNDNKMLLTFQGNSSQQKLSLFLQFDDFETMHRWDLGIYINFNIVTNLNTEKIFQKRKQKQKQTFRQSQQSQIQYRSTQIDQYKKEQKQALRRFLQDKKKYVQSQKHLKNIMIHKINNMKIKNENEKSKKQLLSDKITLQKNIQKEEENIQEKKLQSIQHKKQVKNQLKNNAPQPILIVPQQKEQIKKDDQDQAKKKQVLQQERLRKIKQQQQIKLTHKKKVLEALNVLKKGMYMTKYAKSAFNPHEKKVFISDDYQKLCWQNKDSSDIKFVLISQIQSMQRGQIGPGVEKHIGSKKIQDPKCFVTIKTNHKDRKIIQFGMKSISLMDEFSDSLQIFLSEYKKGNLQIIRQ